MTVIVVIFLPAVIADQGWTYNVLRRRLIEPVTGLRQVIRRFAGHPANRLLDWKDTDKGGPVKWRHRTTLTSL